MNQRYCQIRFTLRGFADCRLVSPNGRNVAMKWLWLPGPRMKSVDEHALHGFRGILLQSWSWCACQPWRSVSNEGSVSHENICRNWERTWNMVRNLPAELTLEKKFRIFCLFILRESHPSKSLKFKFIEGNEHHRVEVLQSRWSHHIMAISICAKLTAAQNGAVSRWTRFFIKRRFGLRSSWWLGHAQRIVPKCAMIRVQHLESWKHTRWQNSLMEYQYSLI